MRETSIDHIQGDDFCTFYTCENWGIKLIKEMINAGHSDVKIIKHNVDKETGDEFIMAQIPFKCMKYVRYPSKRSGEVNEELKQKRLDAMKKARELKKKAKESAEGEE